MLNKLPIEKLFSLVKNISNSHARWIFYGISISVIVFFYLQGKHKIQIYSLMVLTLFVAIPDFLKLKDYILSKKNQELERKIKKSLENNFLFLANAIKNYPKVPVFLFLGDVGSGKTTLLEEWNFSLQATEMKEKYENSQVKVWWRSDALILEIPGRYLTEPCDVLEWSIFLNLLRKQYGKNIIRGAFLLMSVYDVMIQTPERFLPNIKESIKALKKTFSNNIHFWVFITKLDQLEGFDEFLSQRNVEETFMGIEYFPTGKKNSIVDFEELYINLFHQVTLNREQKNKVFCLKKILFPEQFKSLTKQFISFLGIRNIDLQRDLSFSGIYFTATKYRDITIIHSQDKTKNSFKKYDLCGEPDFLSKSFPELQVFLQSIQKSEKEESYAPWFFKSIVFFGFITGLSLLVLSLPSLRKNIHMKSLANNMNNIVQDNNLEKGLKENSIEELLEESQKLEGFMKKNNLSSLNKNDIFSLLELRKTIINYMEFILREVKNPKTGEEKNLQKTLYDHLITTANKNFTSLHTGVGELLLSNTCIRSGLSLKPAYTKKSYENVILPELSKIKELFHVISPTVQSNSHDNNLSPDTPWNILSDALQKTYQVNYEKKWLAYLNSTYCEEYSSLQEASMDISGLSSNQGAIAHLIHQYEENQLQNHNSPDLQPYLDSLKKLSEEISEMDVSEDPSKAALEYAKNIFSDNSNNNALKEAYRETLLYKSHIKNNYEEAALSSVLEAPLKSLWSLLLTLSLEELNKEWKAKVYGFYAENLQIYYPFNSQGDDLTLENFDAFFNPVNGIWENFKRNNLSYFFLDNNGELIPKIWLGKSLKISPLTLQSFAWTQRLEKDFYSNNKLFIKMNFYPHPSTGIQGSRITLSQQEIHYQNEPQRWQNLSWPTALQDNETTLVITTENGESVVVNEILGDWSIFHLFSKGKIIPLSRNNYKIIWAVNKNNHSNIVYQVSFKTNQVLEDVLIKPQGVKESL